MWIILKDLLYVNPVARFPKSWYNRPVWLTECKNVIWNLHNFWWMICVGVGRNLTIGLFLYPQKASENQKFSDFLGGIERDQRHEMG